jgi:sugar O-acyltransferase (sialic acid O-acetyltransferase NeuD family)
MYLYGASGHCKVVIEAIKSSKNVKIDAVFDDNSNNDVILSIPIIKPIEVGFSDLNNFIITIGNNRIRKKIVQSLKVNYLNAIDSSSIISESAKIDFGTVILAGAIINAEAKIGKHCIINSGAVVEHDCIIEDFVHVSPKAALAGNVRVCEGANIGIGAVVIQGLTIGKWSTIGAGSVIIKDVPDYAVVVGNPGNIIKYNDKNINE